MKMHWIPTAALTAALAVPVGMAAAAHAAPQPAAPGVYQERGWEEPPDDYRDAQREGFRDGIEAARNDFQNRNHRDADDHDRYRRPPVDRQFVNDYRNAFREGYSRAMHHMRDERHDRDDQHPY